MSLVQSAKLNGLDPWAYLRDVLARIHSHPSHRLDELVELEVPLHILLVTFQAMKRSGRAWPVVTEEVQEICLQRLTARARFNEGLPGQLADQMVQQFCDEHPERFLLAFVFGYLGDHGLLRVRTDAQKYLVLAALNLAECVAFVGSTTSS